MGNAKSVFVPLVLVGLIATAMAAQGFEGAREAFARDVAVAYSVAPAELTVQPQYSGLPDNPFDALATPPFFAVRADWPGVSPGLQGFAADDGRTVFARGHHGIAHIVDAVGLRGDHPLDVADIVERLMWVYQPGPLVRLIEGHPDFPAVVPPTLERADTQGAVSVVWYMTRAGQTGTILAYRATFRVGREGEISLVEERLK